MATRFATRIVGIYILLTTCVGLFFNLSVFRHFLSQERSSFQIMCMSKSVSNSFSLCIYLAFVGPTCLFYNYIAADVVNKYLNQTLGFALFLQGSMTQTLITMNRLLVVFSNSMATPRYSNPVTVGVLGAFWCVTVYFSLLVGFEDDCFLRWDLEHIAWTSSECTQALFNDLLIVVVTFGVFSNTSNALIACKLICASKTSVLSNDANRRRRRSTIRFFVQSCCQDWLYALDMLSCYIGMSIFLDNDVWFFITNNAADVMVSVVDGLVMFLFNWKAKIDARKVSHVTVSRVMHKN